MSSVLSTFYTNIYNSIIPNSTITNTKLNENDVYNRDMPLELRKETVNQLKIKYPNKIPIIVEAINNVNGKNNTTPKITKNKFLASPETTVGHFIYEMRKYMNIGNHPDISIFIYISKKGIIPSSNIPIGHIYNLYKEDDGILVIYYSGESTFGK